MSDQGQSLPGQQTADAAAPGAAKPTAAPRLGLNADATTPAAPASGLGGIGELFGNLFGGGSANPSAATAPPAVASTTVAEVLPWADKGASIETSSTTSEPPASSKPAAKPVTKPAKAGTVRIQVAAVKTRDEASSVISKLQALGGVLAAYPATVDEAKFGAMGTFFRVRLGPFASTAAAQAPCDALKSANLDCLVTVK